MKTQASFWNLRRFIHTPLFLFHRLFFANMYEDDWGRAGIAKLLMIHLGFIVISPFLLRWFC